MMYETLKKETIGLSDYAMMRLIDYARFLKFSKNIYISESRMSNIGLLNEIKETQSKDDEDYVTEKVIDNTLRILFNLDHQPELFKTYENSINMQFELKDGSYLEFEVFEDRITSMMVPERDYDKAVFPAVSLEDVDNINRIVGEFYGNC